MWQSGLGFYYPEEDHDVSIKIEDDFITSTSVTSDFSDINIGEITQEKFERAGMPGSMFSFSLDNSSSFYSPKGGVGFGEDMGTSSVPDWDVYLCGNKAILSYCSSDAVLPKQISGITVPGFGICYIQCVFTNGSQETIYNQDFLRSWKN